MPSQTDPPTAKPKGVSIRAILLGLLLIPGVAWFNMSVEEIRYAGQPTTVAPMPHILALLLIIVGFNSLAGRIRPSWKMSTGEVLTVYFMAFMGASMSSHDLIAVMTPTLTYGYQYANPANGWARDILPYIPKWMAVSDPHALQSYYTGNVNFWQAKEMAVWVKPLLIWSAFFSVLAFGTMCLAAVLRKQWTERERLSYPLVQFTLELLQPKQPVFRNPLFWTAFGIAAIHDCWFGLAALFPTIPIPYTRMLQLETFITSPPWNSIGWTPMAFFPWLLGIGVLLPTDLLFSLWFFFWCWKLEPVIAAQYGWSQIPGFPYVQQQMIGCIFAISAFTIYMARHALWKGLSAIWRKSDGEDANEPLPYRWAAWGFIFAQLALFGFFSIAGMSAWMICAVLGLYLLISIAFARMRAELGVPETEQGEGASDRLIPVLFGNTNMTNSDIAMIPFVHGFCRGFRSNPMPLAAESYRAAERTQTSMRSMFWAIVLAAVWACVCAFFINVGLHYHWGAAAKVDSPYVSMIFGNEGYTLAQTTKSGVQGVVRQGNVIAAMAVGFIATIALFLVRLQMVSFPLHPVGLAVSANWGGAMIWFTMLIAWTCKVTLLKIGGLKLFQRALPFFLGLTLGECMVGTMWYLISALTGTKTFIMWPY